MCVLFWNENVEIFFQVINNDDGEVLIAEENSEETTSDPTDKKVRYLGISHSCILF